MTVEKLVPDSDITVAFENLSVVYRTPSSKPEDRKKATLPQRVLSKAIGRDPLISVTPFEGITSVARKGEFIGVIGRNGAGKSTLLRAIAGAENLASGRIYAAGQPTLLGVSAALLPQLSGRENARLGCLAMGMTPEQTDEALPGIIEFSELGEAIHRPMKTYSSGMGARLRFAIATSLRTEILLVDEALSTGDATFQDKSAERMRNVLGDAGTVYLVSHSIQTILDMCNRAIWLHEGEIIGDGDVEPVMHDYRKWVHALAHGRPHDAQPIIDYRRETYQKPNLQFDHLGG